MQFPIPSVVGWDGKCVDTYTVVCHCLCISEALTQETVKAPSLRSAHVEPNVRYIVLEQFEWNTAVKTMEVSKIETKEG